MLFFTKSSGFEHEVISWKKGPDRYLNHGKDADPYVCMLGDEFIIHGAQQVATNKVINKTFPGFEEAGDSLAFHDEWYSLKDFDPDIRALTVTNSPAMAIATTSGPTQLFKHPHRRHPLDHPRGERRRAPEPHDRRSGVKPKK